MALMGKVICLTGFSGQENDSLTEAISTLGGIVSVPLIKNTFCLVCKKYGTEKYIAAIDNKIPVVNVHWVNECVRLQHLVPFHEYFAFLFSGFKFTISGIYGTARSTLIDAIINYGGKYSSDLIPTEITHLVCEEPTGDKFNVASQITSICIVTSAWIHECIKSKNRLNETPFIVQPIEQIPVKVTSNQKNESSLVIKSDDNVTVDQSISIPSKSTVSEIESWKISFLNESILKTGNPNAFINHIVFIDGYEKETLDYLTAIIIYGGGFRSHLLTNHVTTILLGELSENRIVQSALKHPYAICVKTAWIVQSFFGKT